MYGVIPSHISCIGPEISTIALLDQHKGAEHGCGLANGELCPHIVFPPVGDPSFKHEDGANKLEAVAKTPENGERCWIEGPEVEGLFGVVEHRGDDAEWQEVENCKDQGDYCHENVLPRWFTQNLAVQFFFLLPCVTGLACALPRLFRCLVEDQDRGRKSLGVCVRLLALPIAVFGLKVFIPGLFLLFT